jgi:hypothetical protein
MKFDNSIILMTHPYDYGLTMILKKIVCQNQRIIINENRFCFNQFLNIFFKAVIVFLLIIAGVETNLMTHPYDYGLTMILKKIVCQNQRILL